MADERCLQNGGFLGFGKEKRRLAAQLEESRQEAARIKADNERIQADNARIQADYEAKHASMQGQASQRDGDLIARAQRKSAALNVMDAMKAVKAMLTEQRRVDKIYYAIAAIRTKQCRNAVTEVIEQTISEDRLTQDEEDQLKELIDDYVIAVRVYNGSVGDWVKTINNAHDVIVSKCSDIDSPGTIKLEAHEYGNPLTEVYEHSPESVPGLLKIRQVYRDADVKQETAEINAFYLKLREEIAALAKFSEEGSAATEQEKSIHKTSYAMKVHAYKTLQEGMFSGVGVDLVKNYPSVQRYNRLLQETRHIALMSGVKPPTVTEAVMEPALSIEREGTVAVPSGPEVSLSGEYLEELRQGGGAAYQPHAGIGFLALVGAWTSENVRGEEIDKFVPGGWFESLTAKLSGDVSDKLSCKNWIAGAIPFFDLWNQLQNARLANDDAGLKVAVTEWTELPPTAPSVLETPARPLPADPVARKEFVRQNSMVIGKKSGKNDEGDCDCRLMWDAINAVEKRAGLSLSGPYSELNGRTGPLRDPVKERPEGIMGPTLARLDPFAGDVSNYEGFSQNRYIEVDGEKMRIPDNKKVKKHNGKYVDFMIAGPGERLALKPYDNHLFKTGILYFETDTASKGPRDPRLDRLDPFDEQYIKPRALGVRFPASDLRIQAPPSDRNAPVSIGSDGYDTLGRGDGSLEEPLTPSASVQARIDATQAGLDAEDATSSELGNAGPLPSIEPPARRRFGSFRTRKEREDLNDLRPWKSMGGGAKATYVIGNVALAAVTVAAAFFAAA